MDCMLFASVIKSIFGQKGYVYILLLVLRDTVVVEWQTNMHWSAGSIPAIDRNLSKNSSLAVSRPYDLSSWCLLKKNII